MWGMRSEDSPEPDRLLEDGDTITVGQITFKVLHTPGHTPGGISLHADAVFVGDTLFAGSIGRTDFPGGDFDTLISASTPSSSPCPTRPPSMPVTCKSHHHRTGEEVQSLLPACMPNGMVEWVY
jgi:hypothetical protein